MNFIQKHKFLFVIIILILICLSMPFLFLLYESHKTYYTAEDFEIMTVISSVDANQNGVDDYTDILLGARLDAEAHPTYDGRYWDTGYPPDDIGVCTDVIWRAFKNAGYNLRAMVDYDINISNDEDYHIKYPDSNIDFRRVGNLEIFFSKYATNLTLDINDIEEWQPGDIVVFNSKHIGIISDKRNRMGEPYVIHNSGQPLREEDVLRKRNEKDPISGHFRWDASKIEDILIYWEN